jgi:hypothetical protein
MKAEVGFGVFYFFIVVVAIGLMSFAPISQQLKTLGLYLGGFLLCLTPLIIFKW